jgi:hypothetical protein
MDGFWGDENLLIEGTGDVYTRIPVSGCARLTKDGLSRPGVDGDSVEPGTAHKRGFVR